MTMLPPRMVLTSVVLATLLGAAVFLFSGSTVFCNYASSQLRRSDDPNSIETLMPQRELTTFVVLLDEETDGPPKVEIINSEQDENDPVRAAELEEIFNATSVNGTISNTTLLLNNTLEDDLVSDMEEIDDTFADFEATDIWDDLIEEEQGEVADVEILEPIYFNGTELLENTTNTTILIVEDTDPPSMIPTSTPSLAPTLAPSSAPTLAPTSAPTKEPTSRPTSAPTVEPFGSIAYVGNDERGFYAPYPLGVCQGDCDSDADCAEGLYCFQRDTYQDVPGCTGGSRYVSNADFCVWNATSGIPRPELPETYVFGDVSYIGNDGTWYDTFPLKACRGDCDTDADCAEGLYCYDRVPFSNAPGCGGGTADGTTVDVCVWNTSFPQPKPDPVKPDDVFQMKLYWQEGYLWQNETFERKWCMSYNYDGYPGTGGCWYYSEFRNCSLNEVYTALCIDGDPRQWFTFVDLGTKYNDVQEVLIQSVGERSPRCFVRQQSAIFLDPNCNPDNPQQRFFAIQGSFTGYRFELGQYQEYTRDNCLTNAHHPKSGEVIEFHICEEARKLHDETSYWERYYGPVDTKTAEVAVEGRHSPPDSGTKTGPVFPSIGWP